MTLCIRHFENSKADFKKSNSIVVVPSGWFYCSNNKITSMEANVIFNSNDLFK